MSKSKQVSPELQSILIELVKHFDKEDTATRERQIRTARRLKLFWDGYYRTWYSETAHDWRVWDLAENGDDNDQTYYDKPVNVFRAYLESIFAALSITVPPIKCFPDDADNPLDLATARAGDKIAQLLYRHNNVSLLWLHSLFVWGTEGLVAAYCYPKSDDSYGSYDNNQTEEVDEQHQIAACPNCGYQMSDALMDPAMQAQQEEMESKLKLNIDKFMPTDEDVPIQDYIEQEGTDLCPACMQMITPQLSQQTLVVTRIVGVTQEPKTRICMESYGTLYVKVANYAKKQADTPYLIFSYETHYVNAIQMFKHLHGSDKLRKKLITETGPKDPYEEWGRLNPQYMGTYPDNTVTIRNAWLRPAAFNYCKEERHINELNAKFPNGVKVVLANDEFGEACNEALDDCWSLTHNPLSDYLTHDPLGLLLTSIQEITNDLISLTIQTIENGIGQTFADPAVLNFKAYGQTESVPGGVYEATPRTGKSISDAFYQVKTASLSPEVMPFAQNVQSLAQLVSGALPSLFGGAIEGSETASQYSMSRAQALQRLQNTWKMLTSWWKDIFGKAIPMFIEETRDEGDQREVMRNKDGSFINTFIRRSELEGKIGKVELEANENLPLTWAQQKDVIMQLLQAGNPEILAILGAPENLPIVREAIGLNDFFVPNEDDVEKQYDEIKLLLNSTPIPTGNPMQPAVPSVEVDMDFDNHQVEFEICRKWIISEAGRLAKMDNQEGYQNVVLHALMHKQAMVMTMPPPQDQASEGDGATPNEKPNPKDQEAPIMGESNVATVQ